MDLTLGLVWELAWKTASVIALLYGVMWAARRFSAQTGFAPAAGGITVLHTVHLGPGRTVHLLAVGGRTLLVGATSQQVSFLSDIGPQEEFETQERREFQLFDGLLAQASEAARSLSSRLRGSGDEKEAGK